MSKVTIKDMKQGEYYLHKKSGIVLFILSNTVANTKPGDRTLVYSWYAKGKWQPDQSETHSEAQDMEVSHITAAVLGSVPRHSKDTNVLVKKAKSTGILAGADKDLGKFFKSLKKEVPAAAPRHPKRSAIAENKNANQCVKCSKPTKELALFNSVTRWCPDCE